MYLLPICMITYGHLVSTLYTYFSYMFYVQLLNLEYNQLKFYSIQTPPHIPHTYLPLLHNNPIS